MNKTTYQYFVILFFFCVLLRGEIIMAKTKKFPRFVVHKHDASHLHYDLRIEIHGSLVSWAIPKGIAEKINEKHLAIKQPDHLLSYIDFEGVIEEGYGAGTVEIWDEGYVKNLKSESLEESLKKGKLEFEFCGKKLKGNYALIKSNFKEKSAKQDTWLIFKISKKSKSSYAETSSCPKATADKSADKMADKKIKKKKSARQRKSKKYD